MSQNDAGPKTFLAGEALEPWRRVKLSAANTIVYADSGEASIGVTQARIASGAYGTVKLWTASGTWAIEASGVITAAAEVYGADDGKVWATASGTGLGWANKAAVDGEVFEVIKMQSAEA